MLRAIRWFTMGALLGAAAFAMTACAGMQRALDAGGQHGTQLVAGTLLGGLLWLLHPIGVLGAGIAALGGAAGALLFGHTVLPPGGDGGANVAQVPGIPWALLILLGLAGAAWFTRARWIPLLVELIKKRRGK